MTAQEHRVPGRATIAAYAVLFPTFALLVAAKEAHWLSHGEVKRGVGIVLALMLAVTGNFLPKLLHPDRNVAAAMRRQRRTAWGLVLTGLSLVAALIVAPVAQIELWTGIVGLGGLSLVLIDALSLRLRPSLHAANGADQSALEKKHAGTRLAALMIVHAIAWVFAMFLADYIWGDAASKWTVIGFALSNSVLALYCSPEMRRLTTRTQQG